MVSTHLKNISQIGNFPQVGVKMKNIWNHHPDDFYTCRRSKNLLRYGIHQFSNIIWLPKLNFTGRRILTFGIQEFPWSRLSLFRLFYLNPVYGIASWFLETCNLLIFIGNLPFPGKITLIPSLVKPCLYHNSQPTHTNNSPNWPLIGTPKQSHCPWECAHAHLPWVTL